MTHPEHDEPVYWFVRLEMAIHRGDFAEADRARRELKRLGIDVTYKARAVRVKPEEAPCA